MHGEIPALTGALGMRATNTLLRLRFILRAHAKRIDF
jgi:hypothetical protein